MIYCCAWNVAWLALVAYLSIITQVILCAGDGSTPTDESSPGNPSLYGRPLLSAFHLVMGEGGSVGDKRAESFLTNYTTQIYCERLHVVNDNLIVIDNEDGEIAFTMKLEEFKLVFYILFVDFRGFVHLSPLYYNHRPEQIIRLVVAAACLATDPLSETEEMKLFRRNTVCVLSQSANFTGLDAIESPDEIPGATRRMLFTIMSMISGVNRDLLGCEAYACFTCVDGVRFVVFSNIFAEFRLTTVFFHLLRLCGVVELNIRKSLLKEPLPEALRMAIGRCKIATLLAPLDGETCRNLLLAGDFADKKLQDATWPYLSKIAVLSNDDELMNNELEEIVSMEPMEFLRGIVRQKVKPADLSVLRGITVPAGPVERYLPWLEQATNVGILSFLPNSTGIGSMPQSVKRMTKLEIIQAVNVGLTDISGDILKNLPILKVMFLSNNMLRELPEEIGTLRELVHIAVDGNQLTSLPSSIVNCTALQLLYASENRLEALPEGLEALPNLLLLSISDNRNFSLVRASMKCTSLYSLRIGGNQITELPAAICDLARLESLVLTNSNLTEVPPQVTRMTSLIRLNMADNSLAALPMSIRDLEKLLILQLANNNLQRLPRVLEDMKKANSAFKVMLSGNPLLCDDTEDELGIRSLWKLFGTEMMSEDEYIGRILEVEKRQFYENLSRRPGHQVTSWDMEKVRQLIMVAPPPHEIKSEAEMLRLWSELLRICPWDETDNGPIQSTRMAELIHVIFHLVLSELRGHGLSNSNKELLKDYLEAVLLDILCKLDGGREEKRETAVEMVRQLNESLEFCPSRQLAELMSIYSLYCGTDGKGDAYRDVFTKRIGNSIARTKENTFTGALASQGNAQNVHLMLFWKKQLKGELGLSLEFNDPYGRHGTDIFENEPIRVLSAFFAVFTPESVTTLLTQEINEEGKVGEAAKYLDDLNLLPVELRGEYFELAEGVEEAAENYCFTKITERGVRRILLSMGILMRTH